MATVAQRMSPVKHYAQYHDVYGIATLRAGGYTFQADLSRDTWLVSYKDVDLMLFGRCDLADAQWAEDLSHGDLAGLAAAR
jgi:hypothetical protein